MTEVQLLFLVLAFIYACECVCWLPAGAVAFRTWLGRRWRPDITLIVAVEMPVSILWVRTRALPAKIRIVVDEIVGSTHRFAGFVPED